MDSTHILRRFSARTCPSTCPLTWIHAQTHVGICSRRAGESAQRKQTASSDEAGDSLVVTSLELASGMFPCFLLIFYFSNDSFVIQGMFWIVSSASCAWLLKLIHKSDVFHTLTMLSRVKQILEMNM